MTVSPRYRFGGRVSVLDMRGGAIARAVDPRDQPMFIAVDARRGHPDSRGVTILPGMEHG